MNPAHLTVATVTAPERLNRNCQMGLSTVHTINVINHVFIVELESKRFGEKSGVNKSLTFLDKLFHIFFLLLKNVDIDECALNKVSDRLEILSIKFYHLTCDQINFNNNMKQIYDLLNQYIPIYYLNK